MWEMNKICYESLTEMAAIGQGQFGQVFKAKMKSLKIPVAVKILKGNVSQRFKELLQEAEKLNHASTNLYVTRLIGIVEDPPCIVMELMDYGSLGTLMENGTFIPWSLKYRILHEVAMGMNWLHSISLLHLDLKPSNVLLNDGLHIRITDFGLSKFTSVLAAGGDNEEIGGTLEYMPPEAFQEGYHPSESTDIYSFAILSAVVLRGQDPYPVNVSGLISFHVSRGERPSFESLENMETVKNLDKAINLCKQCWHSDMHQRPSFCECCTQWEAIQSVYEDKEIRNAVRTVQRIMDCPDSTSSTTDVPQTASLGTANTNDMLTMIKQFETSHISELPSVKQKSVPVTNPNRSYPRPPVQGTMGHRGQYENYVPSYRPESGLVSNPMINHNPFAGASTFKSGYTQQYRTMPRAPNFRTGAPYFETGYPFQRPQYFAHYANPLQTPFLSFPANIDISGNVKSLQFGNNNKMVVMGTNKHCGTIPPAGPRPPSQASFRGYPSQPQSFNVTINGHTDAVQFGNNNEMTIMGSSQNTYAKPVTPLSGQTVHTNVPSAPPTTASKTHLSKETAKQNNQPAETSPQQDANMRFSLQRQDNGHLDNTQTENASFVKPVQEAQDQ